MTSPSTENSSAEWHVSAQVTLLGEALAPVANKLHRDMSRRVRSCGHEFETLADLTHHMGIVARALSHLSPRLDDLMVNVVRNEKVAATDVGRAAGRLEQVLSEFVDGYHETKASRASPSSLDSRQLMLGIYRHHIKEISQWLDELVAAISTPLAALQERAIPLADGVVLTIALNLTSPPQMERLLEIAHELQIESAMPVSEQAQHSRAGLLATLGAMVFGLGAANALWGKEH